MRPLDLAYFGTAQINTVESEERNSKHWIEEAEEEVDEKIAPT